ncbi:MAG: hypothetical protein GTO45_18415 [Candidatus Aminicenantes bacterium]|nr:hypothetical protein [Candidatus Aminicenantes bacterium]NIM80763.1 hypothetical protein [Candidatus Aminicenantes bacterium]NIN20146.1 hypothetical protein [Candidatus Aminicenantes bacterium]NIN43925.1 hypothetical protein [Candidatus Aminicenantes bacterium]NIN86734.1 hypothetical protein [Candidatus Aminicenantes bacterium]
MNNKAFLQTLETVFLLIFILSLPLKGDWKKDIRDYFSKAHEYDKIVTYLEENLPDIPVNKRPPAIIILCFAYSEMGDTVNEEKWVSELFENYDVGDPDFSFLSRKERVKIYEYLQRWKRRYPGVNKIIVDIESQKIRYFNPPAKFLIDIDSRAPSEITLVNLDKNREIIYAGYLKQGPNTIGFPFDDFLEKRKETRLEMVLKSGSIELKKTIVLAAEYHYPEHVKFDPLEGKIAIIGKEFKKETSEETITETQRYFDKKNFVKNAVFPLAVGCALYLLDSLVVRSALNRESTTAESKALLNGIDKTSTVVVIGFSLKGLIHVFRSFKKEKKVTVKTVTHADAVSYNNTLRKQIREAKENIFVTFAIKFIQNKGQQ